MAPTVLLPLPDTPATIRIISWQSTRAHQPAGPPSRTEAGRHAAHQTASLAEMAPGRSRGACRPRGARPVRPGTFALTSPIDLAPLPARGVIRDYTAHGNLTLHGTTRGRGHPHRRARRRADPGGGPDPGAVR